MKRLSILFVLLFASNAYAQYDARWVEVPNSHHNPKVGAAVVYDPDEDRVVMMCGAFPYGHEGLAIEYYYSREVWQLDEWGWGKVSATGPEISLFRPRSWTAHCYDFAQNRIIVAGGGEPFWYSDTWALDGSALSLVHESSPISTHASRGMFFNVHSNTPCLVNEDGQVWQLAIGTFSRLGSPIPNLNPIHSFAHSYNPSNGTLVVMGGGIPGTVSTYSDRTFVWSSVDLGWEEVHAPTHPGPRIGARMQYVPPRGAHILFGGISPPGVEGELLSEVWEFNDSTMLWTELSMESPMARANHGFVYDSGSDRILSVAGSGDNWEPVTKVHELQFIQTPKTGWSVH